MSTPQQNLIITLLQANLTNEKLLLGLMDLHITDPGIYSVDLANPVLSLLGFTDPKPEFLYEYYELQMSRSRTVNMGTGIGEMKELAGTVYEELLRFKAFYDEITPSDTSTHGD